MPTQFIAEVSSNHHRDLARCFDFLDTAARIGCDAVKFQLFAPEILTKSETHRQRKDWELPTAFLPELAQRSHKRGIHAWDASTIDFHLDLEGEDEEFATGHYWLPAQMQDVIESIKIGRTADGNDAKQPAPSELPDRDRRAEPADGLRPLQSIRSSSGP